MHAESCLGGSIYFYDGRRGHELSVQEDGDRFPQRLLAGTIGERTGDNINNYYY